MLRRCHSHASTPKRTWAAVWAVASAVACLVRADDNDFTGNRDPPQGRCVTVIKASCACVRSRRMPEEPKKLGIFTGRGRPIVLAVAAGLVLGMWGLTSAQFFNFGGYQQRPQPQRGGGWFGNEQRGGGWFGNDTYAPYQQQYAPPRHGRQAPPASREDFSKAPPPEKRNTVPERHILVLGDSMADWLAYGLEDVYADQPEMGVVRKHKTASGLIKYQPKGNPADWAAAAKAFRH